MSLVNVLFAVRPAVRKALLDNFRLKDPDDPSLGRVREDLTLAQARKLRNAFTGRWGKITVNGKVFAILCFYVPSTPMSRTNKKLRWVEFILRRWPARFFVVGVWNRDGTQYGTRIEPPEYTAEVAADGTVSQIMTKPQTITGTPVYPVHPRAIEFMPNGEFEDVLNFSGWAKRRWV